MTQRGKVAVLQRSALTVPDQPGAQSAGPSLPLSKLNLGPTNQSGVCSASATLKV